LYGEVRIGKMDKNKIIFQLVWGSALVLAGIGIFCFMPQKMAQLMEMGKTSFYINFTRFCFYLIAVLLIGGGIGKIYVNYQKLEDKNQD